MGSADSVLPVTPSLTPITSQSQPRPESLEINGEGSVKEFQMFITIVLTISIFGASTFAILAGQMQDPAELWKPSPPPFSLATVRRFLAAAWLCFILTIAIAGYSSSLLTILRQRAERLNDHTWHTHWDILGIAASILLHILLVLAFLFLSLGLVAYVGTIGWVAVGFSCLAGTFVVGLSIFQCIDNRRRRKHAKNL
ncbi:hypothetical protein CGMCC3_g14482 [Colletotrichum fructicola]|uniref:PGG domain-containing protein n=1 Tax=Colletotrichum fructicola (strain Nara gc5) TaxID=1213859 RepID=A0A7J6J5D6_COLFN|nr:uncharacterized protein CGMCC3_g14482 [Colletotrichum fructicola]KAE9569424.1 hypothetical protein CGMCC3_g14482 [Colletotrichum fructicola]KAF4483738.1 hypothetical protein CGGC5_v007095 [Colletotrichum fructicola Nara gc5]KAF5498491.1 hypothetical protein CGCF413_v006396 [Colletotrichum fructicola]